MRAHVTTIAPDATLGEAVDLMDVYQVDTLPVVDASGQLVGLLTVEKVMLALLDLLALESVPDKTKIGAAFLQQMQTRTKETITRTVAALMTRPSPFVTETTEASEAAITLLSGTLERIPVVDERGRVVGLLNHIDIIQALFEGHL